MVVHRLQGRPTGVAANEEANMDTVGPWELLIIGLVLVAVFGSSRLPGMARNLGRGLREFRSALREADPIPDKTSMAGGRHEG